ncbi:hypothetical protein [Pedobacter sp. MC2016-24]|uniref:hypothetical protein n=1 Tax=Pedobacter sp. MC2016-24 TaxID=2780090 RepID=UPI00187EEDD2|nr:hypothetical protein [Pedobacter sp. MC2016-24]MBE9600226.1 hypothetical protein [Pedobacter sp. MC2016-24]
MKYLAFIFTCYVLALSVWPCCGNEANLPDGHEDICATSSDTHSKSDENPHACSPFFHASTYHAFVASPIITKAPALILPLQKSPLPEHLTHPVILFPGDIWQPPQLV